MKAHQNLSGHALGSVDPASNIARRIFDEQVAMLFQRSTATIVVGVPFALLISWGLLPYVDATAVWGWFALRCAVTAGRVWLREAFLKSDRSDMVRWERRIVALLALDGFIWGLAGTWLLPVGRHDIVAMLLTSLLGVSALSAFGQHARWRAAMAHIVPMILPAAALQLVSTNVLGAYIGVGLLLFVFLLARESADAQARIAPIARV